MSAYEVRALAMALIIAGFIALVLHVIDRDGADEPKGPRRTRRTRRGRAVVLVLVAAALLFCAMVAMVLALPLVTTLTGALAGAL